MTMIPVSCIRFCGKVNIISKLVKSSTLSRRMQISRATHSSSRTSSTQATPETNSTQTSRTAAESQEKDNQPSAKKRQTLTERDEDHLRRMREAMGGADMANTEFEDGVPDRGMRRNVRENMFRII